MEAMVKRAQDIAIENLKTDGYVRPVLIVQGKKENAIVGLQLRDKEIEMRKAGEKVAFLFPMVVTLVSEAWMARKMPPEGKEIHDMPDKQECISIVSQKFNGESQACFVPFTKVGKEILLGETEWLPEGGVVVANVLKPFWQGVSDVLPQTWM